MRFGRSRTAVAVVPMRAEIDGGNGSGQGGKPGAKKSVGQAITSAACLLGGEHRKPFRTTQIWLSRL
jgi:hypothetical protein